MNCEPGDLAVIVGAKTPVNNGRIVHVLRRAQKGEVWLCTDGFRIRFEPQRSEPYWLVTCATPLRSATLDGRTYGACTMAVSDRQLRPIRDNDGEDETLTWAPRKIEKRTAA